jgi:hypothetical protein
MAWPEEAITHEHAAVIIHSFDPDLSKLIAKPHGLLGDWPPTQLEYVGNYLEKLKCKTIVMETRYIDRDYIEDVALFYSRSLRNYPNHCARLHFFSESFSVAQWNELLKVACEGDLKLSEATLQEQYLGFCVLRPLPGYPVGRTVIKPFPREAEDGRFVREMPCVRDYQVHIGGFTLTVSGLAFQQQDQGVSACATTAVWSAVHCIAPKENQRVATPAEITQEASRYLLLSGRSLPSEGLGIQQICEAIRGVGLAPLVYTSISPSEDKPQLQTYIDSGFAPVLAIRAHTERDGHAVCGVGYKKFATKPHSNSAVHFTEAATAIESLYIHDDRLGPYAMADVYPLTMQNGDIKTAFRIRWPKEETVSEEAILQAIIVPVPMKLRLSATRLREVGLLVAEFAGLKFENEYKNIVLRCRFASSSKYQREAFNFQLSFDGVRQLQQETMLSRYIGLIEIHTDQGPLFDIVVDTTETHANPSVLACVAREAANDFVRAVVKDLAVSLGSVAAL